MAKLKFRRHTSSIRDESILAASLDMRYDAWLHLRRYCTSLGHLRRFLFVCLRQLDRSTPPSSLTEYYGRMGIGIPCMY
jgi:hypothetical protein